MGHFIDRSALPATWRTPKKHITLPEDDLENFVAHDLLATRLESVHNHLWMVGRMLPPRPLHVQLLMSRAIVVTDKIELHLVWTKGKIFVKPLPRYLLDESFCKARIDGKAKLAECARGILFTYTALVASESDFRIAFDMGLLPRTMDWSAWRTIVRRFVERYSVSGQDIYTVINKRYLYGELRLDRLNTIYRWLRGSWLYGYSQETSPSLYSDFFTDNFGKLAAALAYMVIVLTAMQVGLADDLLENNKAFRQACYGFTIFSIVAPLAMTATILFVFIMMFLAHWIRTQRDESRRYKEMDVQPRKLGHTQTNFTGI